ncbi:DMT family transporter [Phaeovulum vinaykumarii]|uniref:Threonine/homoserine efflux transporter RhtA n=1 Tax=Phaeovulum vinaykumarii TaxID=407234 RepID=A0A1N7MGX7_9RHOB|nr:DMT family transporter [Phaeovulum vinaykumarii]SIS85404.1 Threonine/homoserine efflux transporter RhtA [Phaeovulum vinaykumarii]SOC12231.1 threonine/homoserine efflux transporter RhtA [Phaeovulum vinaykumarii]
MQDARQRMRASAIVLGTGAFWGLYWLPVRKLADLGLPGAWGTVAITLMAALVLAPLALRARARIARASMLELLCVALGGAAFALYSVGFVHGRVALVILLYFLTPVWSTLIGRWLMGWPIPPLRMGAIALGLAGLGVMLGAGGGLPLPRGIGEWMALAAGMLWSVSTTGMRAQAMRDSGPGLAPGAAAFVFALGALAAAAGLALALPAGATETGGTAVPVIPVLAVALLAGGLWWGLSLMALMWATVRLEPARVGLLLMTEVVIGAVSAAVLAGETLRPAEILGGALVIGAGVLELWPLRDRRA